MKDIRTKLETTMKKRLVLTAPCLAILAACGGSSTGNNSYENLQNAPAGSVVLSADTPVEVASLDAVAAIDFDNSPVGATVEINEGDYEGLAIKKIASVAGKDSLEITLPSTTILQTVAVGSVTDWLDAVTSFEDGDGVESESVLSHTTNGRNFYNYSTSYERGTTSFVEARVIYKENDRAVKATVEYGDIAGRQFLAVGATRDNEGVGNDSYLATQGNYSYTGKATVFGGDPSYTSQNATMEINFDNNQGSFSANTFTGDEGVADKDISISTNVIVDNIAGTISSSSGTITVEGVEKNVGINGILAHNNNAVVGGIVASESADGVIGGIFSLSKNP